MSATNAEVKRLQGMIGETNCPTYEDEDLRAAIERNPLRDPYGAEPFILSPTFPPSQTANPSWIPTYDLNAAAADLWAEKAAKISGDFDFTTDAGESFKRNQGYENAMKMVRFYRSRRASKTLIPKKYPREDRLEDTPWIGNLPEPED